MGPLQAVSDTSAGDAQHYLVAQATGILMSRFVLSPDAAFDRLTAEADDSGRPVIEVARTIVQDLRLNPQGQSVVPSPRAGD